MHPSHSSCGFVHEQNSRKVDSHCLKTNQNQLEIAHSICSRFENDPNFLNRLVTMDKTWVHFYATKIKQQSMAWKHSEIRRPKTFHVQCFGIVVVLFHWIRENPFLESII